MATRKKDTTSRFLVIGITSIVAIAVVAILVVNNRPRQTDSEHMNLLADLPRGVMPDSGLPYLGDPEAPVTMLLYEDLGCPNCLTFYTTVEPDILENFIVDGEVKLVVYTLAFVNAQSLPAAEGVACALEQDAFWEYRDVVFNNQGVRPFNRENLIVFAEEIGLDTQAFSECYDFGIHTQTIIEKSQTAYEFGITGTPTVEIAGVRYQGVTPYEREDPPGIRLILEAALLQASEN